MAILQLLFRSFLLILCISLACWISYASLSFLSSEHFIILSGTSNIDDQSIKCTDNSWPWNCLSNGSWILRDRITQDDIRRRREIDTSIQEYLGWPRSLFRQDKRCGKLFKIPRTSFPSLCDDSSDAPCCNEAKGFCGKGADHCDCITCQDFSRYVSAEIAQWVPHSADCSGEEFSKNSACDFLQKHISNLVFVGDSLIRHFFTAFAILVTDDYMRGALNTKLKSEILKMCEGEYQFIDHGKYNCHGVIAHAWDELDTNKVCDGTGIFKLSLVEAYSSNFVGHAIIAARKLLGKTGSVLILGVGLHDSLNYREVIDNYLTPVLDVTKKNNTSGWPVIIWITVPTPKNYLKSSIRRLERKTNLFNSKMKMFCNQNNISVFDTTAITNGIRSFDGRHYGFGGNMAKAQLLMRFLKLRTEKCHFLKRSKKLR